MASETRSPIFWAVSFVCATLLARFLYQGYCIRKRIHSLPGPPHSWIFGSLISIGRARATVPRDAAAQVYMPIISKMFDLGDYFYLDTWPFGPPIMMIFNPKMMDEFTVTTNMHKHYEAVQFMRWFGGDGNLVTSEGAEWKRLRSAFNSGFSANHLMTNITPMIVDQVGVFCEIMNDHAKKGDLFRMETASTNLTVDVIGQAVLDLNFGTQKGRHPLVEAFKSQTRWMYVGVVLQPSELWDIRRPIILRWNKWIMNRYIGAELDKRFATRNSRAKSKHIVDLALETYLKEVKGMGGDDAVNRIDRLPRKFKTAAVSNTITFIFAGHDTTSSTIAYSYYHLSKHPEALAKIRKEHDDVFGPDVNDVAAQLKRDVYLTNKLEYTTAVIREVLRLHAPASTIREGREDFFIHDPETGDPLPTYGYMLFPDVIGIHYNEKFWPNASAFRPERYLGAEARNNKEAWVAFAKGSRNCIGQELAMIELRIVLAMTCRSWDFQEAYDEVGKLKGDGTGYPSDNSGIREVHGEKAYQIQMGTAKPREGMPCRLRLR